MERVQCLIYGFDLDAAGLAPVNGPPRCVYVREREKERQREIER